MAARSRIPGLGALAVAVTLAAALAACGTTEFTADEFVERATAEGAPLVLVAPLDSSREGHELHQIEFGHAEAPKGEHEHSGGTLVVAPDGDAAVAEYERCEGAASLVCYRAANVVIYFEGAPAPEDAAALEEALRAMAEG